MSFWEWAVALTVGGSVIWIAVAIVISIWNAIADTGGDFCNSASERTARNEREKSDREHAALMYASDKEIWRLAKYSLRPDTGLQLAVGRCTFPANIPMNEGNAARCLILADLLHIVRMATMSRQLPSQKNAYLIRAFTKASQQSELSTYDILKLWEITPKGHNDCFLTLKILGADNHDDLHKLSLLYISFARVVAQDRQEVLSGILDDIRRGTRNGEEIAKEECRKKYSEVLGVADATSPDEVKAAYRRLVGLWHPDRLDGMAPELKSVATEKLKEINEAYAWLSLPLNNDSNPKYEGGTEIPLSQVPAGAEDVIPEMGEDIKESTPMQWR